MNNKMEVNIYLSVIESKIPNKCTSRAETEEDNREHLIDSRKGFGGWVKQVKGLLSKN